MDAEKAGLIKLVNNSDEASAVLKTFKERGVMKVLAEKAVAIKHELYVSVTAEAVSGKALIMASAEGGVEIEQLAANEPEKIIRETIDLDRGLPGFLARDIAFKLNRDAASKIAGVLIKLFDVFKKKRCRTC